MIWVRYLAIEAVQDSLLTQLLATLPQAIQQHVLQKKRPDDRKRTLIGLLLVVRFLEEHKLSTTLLASIQYQNFVKPAFQGSTVDFNISHTQEYVVAAFSFKHRIGIDIEQLRTVKGWQNCHYFNKNDQERLQLSPNPSTTFLEIWCQKEAVLKACGCGFALPVEAVEIIENTAYLNHKKWYLFPFTLPHNYGIIACDNADCTIVIEPQTLQKNAQFKLT